LSLGEDTESPEESWLVSESCRAVRLSRELFRLKL